MTDAEALKEKVNQEADRKEREAETAKSLPANPNHPVEKPVVKKSTDEVRSRPEGKPGVPEATGLPAVAPAAEKEYVSPSQPLDEKPEKKT